MLIDSHCHLHLLEPKTLSTIENVLNSAQQAGVSKLLSVSVELSDFDMLCALADRFSNVYISLGVHPNCDGLEMILAETLIQKACSHSACIAIGETGLDYYRITNESSIINQKKSFRTHINASIQTQKPLIIHTRQAAQDTIDILKQEQAEKVGGVMHCFTESLKIAKQALNLGFYISLSGIVTFKNAHAVKDLAKFIPLDRLLIETDSPYLAPEPYRGKANQPAYVKYVAQAIANLRNLDFDEIAQWSSSNFYKCFKIKKSS